jgi:hypothetical protein
MYTISANKQQLYWPRCTLKHKKRQIPQKLPAEIVKASKQMGKLAELLSAILPP